MAHYRPLADQLTRGHLIKPQDDPSFLTPTVDDINLLVMTLTMGSLVYSFLWVMQELYHQP